MIDHTRPLAEQVRALGYEGVDYIYSTAPLSGFREWVAALNPTAKHLLHPRRAGGGRTGRECAVSQPDDSGV